MAEVYKTENGRELVESAYRGILAAYTGIPFRQIYVDTSAGKTHVLRFGNEEHPTVVFLHGSMSNSAAWLGIAGWFSELFDVCCIDIPGEPGLSNPERISLEGSVPVLWLESLLEGLGIEHCALVGMSLGSWYAMNFASVHPERITALSMITASGIGPQRTGFVFKALLCMLLGKPGQKLLNRMVYYRESVPSEVLAFQALVSAHFNPVAQIIPIFRDEQLHHLTMPVQYFGGDHDALLDTAAAAVRLEQLVPHAEIHVLEQTGHVIVSCFDAVREFLSVYCLPDRRNR
jgi:pimeloyl-ACP methyl ester carboxylesterase